MRLRLVPEDPSDVPKACHNLVVSIHAIAPFSALDDYLKPRIAGLLSFRSELSPGLLQALAGSSLPSGAMARSVLAGLGGRPFMSSLGSESSGQSAVATLGNLLSGLAGTSSSAAGSGGSTPATTGATSTSTTKPVPIPSRRGTGASLEAPASLPSEGSPPVETPSLSRRRSLRLRGQPPPGEEESTVDTASDAPAPSTSMAPSNAGDRELASTLLQQLAEDVADLDDAIDSEVRI